MAETQNTQKRSHKARQPEQADALWTKSPHIIKNFLEIRPEYEQLCNEVEYILRKKISGQNIQTSFIGSRAKTLNSFIEKLKRKKYKNPFQDLTDFAGARVVCLYNNDLDLVSKIIHEEFTVTEEIDKRDALGPESFGYIGRHYIVQLGKGTSGARYDDLKKFKCEIQVRTVVQDAWAIIQHHMAYKKESEVPTKLMRKLNSLAGLFETVDDQFEMIRSQRDNYLEEIRESKSTQAFLDLELNHDSLNEYIAWKLPDLDPTHHEQISILTTTINEKLSTIRQLDVAIDPYIESARKVIAIVQESIEDASDSGAMVIAICLCLNPETDQLFDWDEPWASAIKRFRQS